MATSLPSSHQDTTEKQPSPQTLVAWRHIRDFEEVHKHWLSYSALLAEHGIELFKYGSFKRERLPPDGVCRSSEDPGAYRLHEPEFTVPTIMEGRFWCSDDTRVLQSSPVVHPARDLTKRWIILRIVRLGLEGAHHLDILRLLSSYPNRADPRNHCLPMLREIQTAEITIAVFPFMKWDDGLVPQFYSVREVLEFVIQTMTGLAYLHENMIAHRDIAANNFVWNLAGPYGTTVDQDRYTLVPWRSQFPIRYFYIDFEHAIQLPRGSDPSACRVKGFPAERFSRFSPPEYLWDVPYSPFAADIFSLGLIYWDKCRMVPDPGFMPLVEQLLHSQPSMRPKAADALCAFHAYRESLSGAALAQMVPSAPWKPGQTHPNAIIPEALAWSLGLQT